MIDQSGAEVHWDHQIGTFTGKLNGILVGSFSGEILSVSSLEGRLGVSLSPETRLFLEELKIVNPSSNTRKITVSKLQFMQLFRVDDLIKIYKMARNNDPAYLTLSVLVQILLDKVDRASNNQVEISDTLETLPALKMLEDNGLLTIGDADRISKGIPWQQ